MNSCWLNIDRCWFLILSTYFRTVQTNNPQPSTKNKQPSTIIEIDKKEKLCEILPIKTDIIIFITGGGFVSDFEKISQYYLREIVKENCLPIFIIKYR